MSALLIRKLTADDTNVPSAYLMKELSDLTLTSAQESDSVKYQLLTRLKNPSPDVKYKALRVIKYVAQHGRSNFRIALQRDCELIKASQSFRGATDPLRGDVPSERVREAASEALEALYTDPSSVQSVDSKRITGFSGGSAMSQPSTTSSNFTSTSSLNEPSFSTAITPGDVLSVVKKKIGETYKDIRHEFEKDIDNTIRLGKTQGGVYSNNTATTPYQSKYASMGSDGSYNPGTNSHAGAITSDGSTYRTYNTNTSTYNPTLVGTPTSSTSPTTSSNPRVRGTVGGGWDTDDSPATLSNKKPQGSFGLSTTSKTQQTFTKPAVEEPISHEPGPYEIKLIDDLTAQTGIRTTITSSDLQMFLAKCQSLDNIAICIYLERKLQQEHTVRIIKSLYLLEALLTSMESDDADDYFNDHPETLYALENHPNKTVQNLVNKCLISLGLRDKHSKIEASSSTVSPSSAAPPISQPSYDIFASLGVPSADTNQPQPTPVADNSVTDIFSQMEISHTQRPNIVEEASSFSFLEDDSPAHQISSQNTASTSSNVDIFADLSSSMTKAPEKSANITTLDSLFSDLATPSSSSSHQTSTFDAFTSPPLATDSNDPFADLMKSSKNTTAPAAQAKSHSTSDPFAFINDM